MTDLSGQYLGRYYLVERLGEGGMAVVYKAYDTRLERDVAVKIIRSDNFPVNALEEMLKRFEREAKSLAKLSHPNIVKVHDYGEHEGSPYLVMEYLPGGTLKKKLGKPVPWQEAVRLILPVARGVAYAHKRGILHRDIKPANVLITDDGEPMLSDFGIAKLFEADQTTALTGSGMAIGTPEYMAPEQWTGVTSPQSDLYSLGIVLYEMVAGRKPYVADTPAAILIKQATEPLPSPRKFTEDLPDALELALIKVLAKEPGERYKDMISFIGALEKLHVSAPVAAPPVPETKLAEKPRAIPVPETVASVPRQAPTALGGETIPAADAVQPETVQGSLPGPIPVKRTPPAIKFSRKGMGLLIGGIVVVLAAWLSSPLIGQWLSSAPTPTETVTATLAVSTQQLVPTQTIQPSPVATKTIIPTVTPLPIEITDRKGVTMRLVPAGEFTMGSDQHDDEKPAHQVFLDSYYVDKYEVTNALYKICVDEGICQLPRKTSSAIQADYYGNPKYDDYPVIYVDWNMAKTYCEWRGAFIPTEAMWEKAARGAEILPRTYPWGEGINETFANYNQNVGDTMAVGSYESGQSVYHVYDLAGNVWEWVSSLYKPYPYISTDGREDLNATGPRVLRGGSWLNLDNNLRASGRLRGGQTSTSSYLGFRCSYLP